MAVVSKEVFEETGACATCEEFFHPWSKTCLGATPKAFIDSFKGSVHFYSIVYVAQIVMHGKKLKSKKMWVKMGNYYARSTLLGIIIPFSFVTMNCLFRKLGLPTNYINSLLIPFTINGLTIYLEPPSRRGLVINLFVNQLIEYWMRCLSRSGYLHITKSKQVLLFMIGSAFLFYLMRLEGDKEQRTPMFWLYTAEKVKRKTDENKTVCPHEETCEKYIVKGYGTYFGIGLAISLAKLILPKIKTPLRALSSIRGKHFKMALFFGSYIGIYRAVVCYLCRKKGFDSALFALPAGYLAGLSMIFNPSTGLAIASVTGALKLYSTILYEKKILTEKIPLPELLYCFCQGILFSARFVDLPACPPYILNLTDTVSHGHCQDIYNRVLEISKRLPAV